MFKKVLPSRRQTANEDESPFEIVTPPTLNPQNPNRRDGKENVPQTKSQRPLPGGTKSWHSSRASVDLPRKQLPAVAAAKLEPQPTGGTTNVAFERMLDDLQIPSTVRVKLTTLETPVKAAMLRSSHVLGTVPPAPATPPSLRRTRSNESLALIRALLLTPAPLPSESPSAPVSPHAFIQSLHTPRIFKTYLQELSDVCRDYFWVFCHPANTIWVLAKVDEAKVERPRAPGGMTGGVEYEAMTYLTTHLKLVNAVSRIATDLQLPPTDEMSAHKFHSDLFASGFERIIATARKASTTYYPTLHLELARYVQLTQEVRFELPWTLSRMVGTPPSSVVKQIQPEGTSRSGTPAGPRPPLK
ncbi:hypothetical protein FRC07_007858 [Ceratobasidium sp. 392]|nr:hypothetical protein FRC07_007858 [Ceratobasidium sp. 392]